MPVRVLVVDDHPATRAGLASYLATSEQVELVGAVGSGREALGLLSSSGADVLLLDIRMPDLDGLELMGALRRQFPRERRPKVLVISSYSEPAYVLSAIKLGASGYLLKTVGPDELVEAVLLVSRGKTVFSEEVAEFLNLKEGAVEELTPRELEVLRLTAKGLSAKEIASTLRLSERTIHGHLASAYGKLGVSNKTSAIAKALKLGLMRVEDILED